MKSWVWCAGYFPPQDTWKWVHTININKKCIHISPSWVSPGVWILNFRKHRSASCSTAALLALLLVFECSWTCCGRIRPASCVCQPCSLLFPHWCSRAAWCTPVPLFHGCLQGHPLLTKKGRPLRAGSLNHLSSSAPYVQYTFVESRQDNLELRQSLSHQKPPGKWRGLFMEGTFPSSHLESAEPLCVCVCFFFWDNRRR